MKGAIAGADGGKVTTAATAAAAPPPPGAAAAAGGAAGGAAADNNKKPPLDAAAAATMKAMMLTAAAAAPLLDDPDGGVREASAELMGLLREAATTYVDALQARMKNDTDEAVRDAATDALARLGYYNPLTAGAVMPG